VIEVAIWQELVRAQVAATIRESDLWCASRESRQQRKEIEARLIRIFNRA
jgi:hypothetical protein